MRKLNLISVSIIVFGFWVSAGSAGTACTSTSYGGLHKDENAANAESLGPGYCFQTPTNMDVTIYEVGICTAHASPTDRTACTLLFDDANGQLVNLSVGSSLDLLEEISITEGTYSHAYILMSNVTAIKTVIQFSTSRTALDNSSGEYCYTNGDSWDDNVNSIMSCGDSASAAVSSVETIGFADENGNDSYSLVPYTVTMAGEQVVSNLYMTDADGTTLSSDEDTSKRILGSQKLGTPVTVTPSTSNIDVSFAITDGVAIGFPNAEELSGPHDAVFEALKFKITAN